MRYVLAICGIILTTGIGLSDPPKVPGPIIAKAGEIVEIEITEDAAGKIGFHNPYDTSSLFVRDAVPRREKTLNLLIQPKERKEYRLTVWTVGEAKGTTLVIDASGGIQPFPNPNPGPNPNPNPDPPVPITVKEPWVIVVENIPRSVDTAKVLNDLKFWQSLPSNIGWRFYLNSSEDAKKYKYDTMAQQTGLSLPVVMLLDDKGNLIKAMQLPKTTDEIRKFVKDNTGY